MAHGVGLIVPMAPGQFQCFTDEPGDEQGQHGNERQDSQTCNLFALMLFKAQTKAGAFQVTKRLFDLHALAVQPHHALGQI